MCHFQQATQVETLPQFQFLVNHVIKHMRYVMKSTPTLELKWEGLEFLLVHVVVINPTLWHFWGGAQCQHLQLEGEQTTEITWKMSLH